MAEDETTDLGNYPFLVFVWNAFKLEIEPEKRISLKVEFNYYPFTDKVNGGQEVATYFITPGAYLAFPFFWKHDKLIISVKDGKVPHSGYTNVWAGIKAGCDFKPRKAPGVTFTPAIPKMVYDVNGNEVYRGGAWRISHGAVHANNDWSLVITKLKHDPEEENVTVGEDPPT